MDEKHLRNPSPKETLSAKDGASATSSRRSGSTRSSKSSVGVEAARARAQAEAARARATFAEKEIAIKVDRARLEACLDALHLEKEAAAAVAQAEVLEAAAEHMGEELCTKKSHSTELQSTQERVSDYVRDQAARLSLQPESTPNLHAVHDQRSEHLSLIMEQCSQNSLKEEGKENTSRNPYYSQEDAEKGLMVSQTSQPYDLHLPAQRQSRDRLDLKKEVFLQEPDGNRSQQNAKYVIPQRTANHQVKSFHPESAGLMDMAKYLARKELVSTGLSKFDDCPETYRVWRSSFLNTIKDLDLTASEELDLLSKWLGKESSEYVKRMRAVHVGNQEAALKVTWDRLEECYGASEVIERALFSKLDSFPKISNRENLKLRELGDLLMELLSAKEDGSLPGLSYLDTARGISPIVEKLPYSLQEKWISQGSKYKEEHHVSYPPFSVFTYFICHQAKIKNDPSFAFQSNHSPKVEKPFLKPVNLRKPVSVQKTEVSSAASQKDASQQEPDKHCPIHNKPHPLRKCRGFRLKTIEERKAYLKERGICFRCCSSSTHLARTCKAVLKCDECSSDNHITALHPGLPSWAVKAMDNSTMNGGEEEKDISSSSAVSSLCTDVCGSNIAAKSCSKICLVKVYQKGQQEKAIRMYAMLDDQSNRSLARTEFFDLFNIYGDTFPYTLKTCAGIKESFGRKATGYQIEAINGGVSLTLPTLIECNDIPDNREEIPTPESAFHHPHLKRIAGQIPAIDEKASILLLLGRDILRAHKVRQQINGPGNAPFAQKLDLGWVLVGDVCLGKVHKPTICSFKTNVLENRRPSLFRPCTSHVNLKERLDVTFPYSASQGCWDGKMIDSLGSTVFRKSDDDDKPALSVEDERFVTIMDKEVFQGESNSWVAPLPFRSPRPALPNNREQAATRLTSLRRTLERNPNKKEQFIAFMQRVFDNNHAEPAPALTQGTECWYLPTFGVYHPRKPDQIRVVFDSSAQYNGISLNNVLLTGPDLNNSLLGVLIRFRKEQVAVTADIEQMFYCFVVGKEHRDYLRFLWYRDNDLSKDIVEYRMRVHVFGNSPSPAVATYCLRRAAQRGEKEHGSDTRHFVERDFYVDDGLVSLPTEEQAISLIKRTQASLAESNLRLHKIVSNSVNVLRAFPTEDHAKDIKELDLGAETIPTQRSLGLSWEVTTDTFTFQASPNNQPFTRRGVLSTVNSLFDPLGFVAPITIQGKFLLRGLSALESDWDVLLPPERYSEWEVWRKSLQELQQLHIPRVYSLNSPSKAERREICIFSDASIKAIAAVAYLKTTDKEGQVHIGFILGKARLAPLTEPTIPRLELCAAVLAVEMAELIVQEMDLELDAVTFYCDSKVVLGYIHNESKRFYVYVHNRVQRIRRSTKPKQWQYVPTAHNPADHASRSVQASQLTNTNWLTGPAFLREPSKSSVEQQDIFDLVDPDTDKEIRPQVTSCATRKEEKLFNPKRFERFSSWISLQRTLATLIHIACSFQTTTQVPDQCSGWHQCAKPHTASELSKARIIVIRSVQAASFMDELDTLSKKGNVSKKSPLAKLDPFMDEEGLLRIGGRLKLADLSDQEKNPVILPGKHHISTLLIRHYHEQVEHQGRIFTEGAIRAAGIWLLSGKRSISRVLHGCVICRKLRGRMESQMMAHLPMERLSTSPPFTYTGLDVFGPWSIVARRTRGGLACRKNWAVLFTCLSTRAIHIEVIESMDASSFINCLRRFFAIRGPSKQLHSDCGTNFVGACKELEFHKVVKDTKVQRHVNNQGCTWNFNPPHASHMGGAWERMIGVARRILDSMLMRTSHSHLTHEVLCTLMAEITAIINSRPIAPISTDADSPQILSPAMLLTQRPSAQPPPGKFTEKDLYKEQWRQVQCLADRFWSRWKTEYLQTLQNRRKWSKSHPNIEKGDIVLLKDCKAARNDWPMALVTNTFPSNDGRVRKVELKVTKHGANKIFLRPVSEVILLLNK